MKKIFRMSEGRGGAVRDVNQEIQFHLEMRAKEFMEQGMDREAAFRAAQEAFGDVGAIAEEVRDYRAASTRRRNMREWLNGVSMDIGFAWRTLRKNPGFATAAVLTLAIGFGATTAVFTVVNGVLLRPLPYHEPHRLAMVWFSGKESDGFGHQMPVSAGFYLQLREQQQPFENTAAFRSWPYTVAGDGPAEQVAGARVTPSFFDVLGVRPFLGQPFTEGEVTGGATHVALISHAFWQRRFGGSPKILGQQIALSGESFTVVGVMPSAFAFPRGAELPGGLQFNDRTDIWTPLVFNESDKLNFGTLNLASIARLKPLVTQQRATTELTGALHRFLATRSSKFPLEYRVVGLQDQAGGSVRRSLLVLMGAVAFVLLIACANVTNLLVARTAARQREFAVRAALGAGRARIARQLVTENIVLSVAGTTLGLALSIGGVRAMLALVPGSMPRIDDVSVDWRVMILTTAVALLAGLAFGIATAYQIRWPRLAATLQASANRATSSVSRKFGRRVLVVAEISLSLMLLIGASELTVSFLRLQRVEPGFSPDHALIADVQMPLANGFDPVGDGPKWRDFFGQLMDQVNQQPGVVAAGAVSTLPLSGAEESSNVTIVGEPIPTSGGFNTEYNIVSGRYFEAMNIRVLEGRAFDARESSHGAPAIIVNQEFVHRYLTNKKSLGTQLNASFVFVRGQPKTIVGVVENVRQTTLDVLPEPQVYVPQEQMSYPALTVVIRTRGNPMVAAAPLRAAVKALNGATAVARVRTLSDVFATSMARQRFSATIIGVFAISALALAMVGLYGVIALQVGQRRGEIGVRMALGARTGDVLRLVLGEGLRITAVAVGVGLAGAFAMSRVLNTLLYEAKTGNVALFAAAAISVGAVSLVATWLPARRATRVDMAVTLRQD